MHHLRLLLLTLLAISIVAIPQLVEARAGGGYSMGSRGTRSFSSPSYNAAPLSRSTATPTAPSYANPGYRNPGYAAPGYTGGSTFWHGLAGGFLGAGVANMLFGHGGGYGGGYGYGEGGGGGGLFSLLLFGGIAWFLFRRFRGTPGLMANSFTPSSTYDNSGKVSPMLQGSYVAQDTAASQSLAITDDDKRAFDQLLSHVQQSWSDGDLSHMRQYVTPEMLQYFSEELSANSSRGLANKMEQVKLEDADIVESWHEYNLDYATARMRFSAIDYMARLDRGAHDTDYVASGDARSPQTVQEFWTFARASGGHWLLSAIQQTR